MVGQTFPCFFTGGALLIHFQSYNNPTQIFADDVTEEKGENARLSAFVGAIAVGDLVKTTLGPKGMDKILQSAYVAAPPKGPRRDTTLTASHTDPQAQSW